MKNWMGGLAVSALALLVGLLLAEVTLRVTGLASPDHGLFTVSTADFESIPGIWEPRQSQIARQVPELPHRVTTNELGYRGAGFPRSSPPGEFRVLYLGDSFTFGSFVDDDETLPHRLEERLEQRWCDDVTVVNAGLGGSTLTEQIPLMKRGLELEPDLVILQFSENDVTDLRTDMWEELGNNRAAKSRFPINVIYPLVRRTALWELILRARAVRAGRRGAAQPDTARADSIADAQRSPPENETATLRERYRTLLLELSEYLRERDIPLLFAVYPSHHSVYGTGTPEQLEWLADVTSELDIDTVEFLPAFEASSRTAEELYLLPIDGHPSPLGYEIAAEELASWIQAHRSCE